MTSATTNTIRSSFCAEGVLGGARLFIFEVNNKFLVATRWQNIGYRKRLEDAIALFERTLTGEA